MFRQDGETESAVDPDDLNFEVDKSQEWFMDTMSRVLPPKENDEDLPQLVSTSPANILFYLGTIIWLLCISVANTWKTTTGKFCTWILKILLPKILNNSTTALVHDVHLNRVKHKWNVINKLPTYSAQNEGSHMLQEINHNGNEETEGFLHPEDAPVKTLVKLLLDQRGRPHVQCILEGVPVTFLVDSGASASILSYSDFCKIKHRDTLVKSHATPKLYDHQHREIKCKYNVMCQGSFEGKTILMSLLVSSASTSNVLGMDILVGRSLVFTHRGTDAYLIIGECKAEKRPVMKLPDRMALYVLEDTLVPSESVRTVMVTPCVYPMHVDIPDEYLEIDYIAPTEGFEGRTKHVKLDNEGKAKLKVCNRSLVDLALHANSVIGTGFFLPDFNPLPAKRVKVKQAKSEKPTPEVKDGAPQKAASVHAVSSTESQPLPTKTDVDEKIVEQVNCFCSLPQSTIVLKGNKFGDTFCPYLGAGSYVRTALTSGASERFKLGKKQIIILFGNTKKDFLTAIDNLPKGNDVVYITGPNDKQNLPDMLQVTIAGNCTEHPFDYSLKPSFISFCRTYQGKHLKTIHPWTHKKVLDILNIRVEMYFDPTSDKQLHYVLHIPDILTLKEQWLCNLVAALVQPFCDTVRILEPYLFPDEGTNHRSTMFHGILQKVATLHGITLQGRMPNMEKTYDTSPDNIKNCTCEYCTKCRDKLTYTNMNGSYGQNEKDKNFLM